MAIFLAHPNRKNKQNTDQQSPSAHISTLKFTKKKYKLVENSKTTTNKKKFKYFKTNHANIPNDLSCQCAMASMIRDKKGKVPLELHDKGRRAREREKRTKNTPSHKKITVHQLCVSDRGQYN